MGRNEGGGRRALTKSRGEQKKKVVSTFFSPFLQGSKREKLKDPKSNQRTNMGPRDLGRCEPFQSNLDLVDTPLLFELVFDNLMMGRGSSL